MRSKLAIGGLTVAVAFLLATNPVVVEAAGQITSGMIKNNTIKSKDVKDNNLKGQDIKDGSLVAADLAPGTLPTPQVKSVKRFVSGISSQAIGTTGLAFYGATTTVAVDGNDTVVATGTLDVTAPADGADIWYALCVRPVGSVAAPTPLGGTPALSIDIDGTGASFGAPLARSGTDILPAGSYTIGMCAEGVDAGWTAWAVSGWAQVIDGTGPLARPTAGRGGSTE